jgi:hypothetical protein
MFTFLTIGAAWFAFGYAVTDIVMTAAKNHYDRKSDE